MSTFSLENTCLKKGCLTGEVAVVTGSTSNVGKGYAQALAWAGAKVVIVGRNEERGAQVAATINEDNGPDTAIFVKCDVAVDEQVANLKAKALEKFGKVDILINNAMDLSLNGTILGSPIEHLDRSYATSARAVMLMAQAFMPGMLERDHGTVVYSTTQFHYLPPMIGGSIYTAGKAAATSATMSLANEVKGTGVHVFCLAPAGVGQINPDSVKEITPDMKQMSMPGFNGLIPASAAGAGLVYCITRAAEMHGTGLLMGNVLKAMNYPFPCPETARKMQGKILDDMDLTMILCFMGHDFPEDY